MYSRFIRIRDLLPLVRRYISLPSHSFFGQPVIFSNNQSFRPLLSCIDLSFFEYYQLTTSHSRGFTPPFGAPTRVRPWTRLPLPLGCQKEHEVLFEGKSLSYRTLYKHCPTASRFACCLTMGSLILSLLVVGYL